MMTLKALGAAVVLATLTAAAKAEPVLLAVTTSFENSGLAERLLPPFEERSGTEVNLLVVGTGQALKLGEEGDVDAVLVHAPKAEEVFVEQGFGVERVPIMYNDFLLIGPRSDPAGLRTARDVVDAMRRLNEAQAPFVSRGDDSGTHKRETELWRVAEIDPTKLDASWYRETGSGMGAALNTAAAMDAYVLADRGTWLSFENKGDLEVLFDKDEALRNFYSYIRVDPERHPGINADGAKALQDWLVSPKAQEIIGAYEIAGQRLFTPNASGPVN